MKTLNLVLATVALTVGLAAPAFASDVDRAQQEITTAIAQGRYQAAPAQSDAPVMSEGRQAASNSSLSANDQLLLQLSLERNASRH
jgi:opacity protein-like surface antigen